VRLCEEIGLEELGSPVVVDIQNVANYVEAGDRGNLVDDLKSFPVMPPWPRAAFEFATGDRVRLCVLSQVLSPGNALPLFPEDEGLVVPDDGFMVSMDTYADMEPGAMRAGTSMFHVATDGLLADFGDAGAAVHTVHDPSKHLTREQLDAIVGLLRIATLRVFSACLFCHCKNVAIRDHTPHMTRQQRRHSPPAITYKVLDIAPMTRVLRDEGGIEHNGLKKALHICRGHFAHYGPDAKLFGKYEGSFWHPMHTRGSAKNGVVVKDYKVSPR